MLVGNPDTFAIWFEAVDSWSTDRFKNGCFSYFIGGELLWSLRSTLGTDLNLLSGLACINESVDDERLFNLSIIAAYAELVERAFPAMDSDAVDSDYKHLVSVESLSDEGYDVFLIESGDKVKIIFDRRNEAVTVREIILTRGEFQSVVLDAIARSRIKLMM